MIYTVTKYKTAGRDWDYIVEFERPNPESSDREGMTLRSNATPRAPLLKKAGEVARLALQYHGLGIISHAQAEFQLDQEGAKLTGVPSMNLLPQIGFGLHAVTWSDSGDDPGSRVEVSIVSAIKQSDAVLTCRTKMMLPKVDRRDETTWIGEGKDRRQVYVENSLKNAYNAAVAELRDLVKAYADGESAQGQLFGQDEAAS